MNPPSLPLPPAAPPRAPAERRRARPGLAVWVAGVSLLALIPMLVFSAVVVYGQITEQQQLGIGALQRRAGIAGAAVGHGLESVASRLAVMAQADSARQGDLDALHGLAGRIVSADARLHAISLDAVATGRPVFSTAPGAARQATATAALLQPLAGGSPRSVSPVIVGAGGERVVAVAAPLTPRAGDPLALVAEVRLDAIGATFNEQGWPADWTAAIIDQNGIIIARSRDAERYIGQTATPSLIDNLRAGRDTFHATTKDGVATVTGLAPVPDTQWHVVVGRPLEGLNRQVRDSMTSILAAGLLSAALGIGAGVFLARSMGRQLRSVVAAHERGDPGAAAGIGILEIQRLADALSAARQSADRATRALEAAREDTLAQLKERGDMLDVLAHEVRQPLNNASAALQAAHAVLASSGEPAAADSLTRAEAVLTDVQASIDNTLAVASLLAGGDRAHAEDTDIDALIGVATADMPPGAATRVRVERATPTRTASMDPNLMRLALRNLMSNALKFSPADRPVTIRIADSDEPLALIIDVEDAGPGIDADRLPRLFDRGDRKPPNRGGRRQGLGLYIVRRVMELHGGSVSLHRNGPRGATMRLTIVQSTDD